MYIHKELFEVITTSQQKSLGEMDR